MEARGALGEHLTSLKMMATHISGLVTRDNTKPQHWDTPAVARIRAEIYCTMLVLYKTLCLYLTEAPAHTQPADSGLKAEIQRLVPARLRPEYAELVGSHDGQPGQVLGCL